MLVTDGLSQKADLVEHVQLFEGHAFDAGVARSGVVDLHEAPDTIVATNEASSFAARHGRRMTLLVVESNAVISEDGCSSPSLALALSSVSRTETIPRCLQPTK